jgi:hypothetical protein
MIFGLDGDPADRARAHFPPLTALPSTLGEQFSAGLQEDRIANDRWANRGHLESALTRRILDVAGPDPNAIGVRRNLPMLEDRATILARAQSVMAGVPGEYLEFPTTLEEFDAEIDRQLQNEFADAQAVGANAPAGSWVAPLAAGIVGAATDQTSLMLAPLGFGGSIAKVMASEAILGVAGEALTLPRQFEMAETLGIQDPNVLAQLSMGAVGGAVLGGAIAGAPRALSFGADVTMAQLDRFGIYRNTRNTADPATIPPGTTPIEHEQLVARSEDAMINRPDGAPLTADDFPVNAAPGNRSRTVQITYAYGDNTIRDMPVSQTVLDGIQASVAPLGPNIEVRIVSGGQPVAGDGPRTGSTRHDVDHAGEGGAADIVLVRDGQVVLPGDDPALYEAFFREAGAQFTGLGHYGWGVHVGGGDLASWGPDRTSATLDPRFGNAIEEGRAGRTRNGPPAMSDFDYSPAGNASPVTNRPGYVFGQLVGMGHDPQVVAAFVGNMMVESTPTMNPATSGDGGNAYGIVQWNGPRRVEYLAFARSRGKPPEDIDTQIAYWDREIRTTERAAYDAVAGAPDIETAASLASARFFRPGIPHINQRIAYARELLRQYQDGRVPRWQIGQNAPSGEGATDGPTFYDPTFRGYTGTDQVRYGEGRRIDVTYQVVDARLLQQASGDLQPRDRSQARSDLWVNQTAADLDPALLMRSPTADRGAPIVGPDDIIESGNGRILAIQRAYAQFPDRAAAYRGEIEKGGFTIPAGIEEPVLIARRQTPFNEAERVGFVQAAQDSGVAVMTAAERAKIGRQSLTADTLDLYRPAAKLNSAENRDFARRFVAAYPPSQQGTFVANDKSLSTDGIRQLRDAIFARAYEADDILRRYIEEDPGELKSLLDALATAAPDVAMLRAAIEADLVRPDMDIIPFVLDAARLIMNARDIAAREGGKAAAILDELLADTNLLGDVVPPLTAALVGKMMPGGKQAPADTIANFLIRYSRDALAAGRVGDPFAADGPLPVLKAIDPKSFGDLIEIGTPRGADRPRAEPRQMPAEVLASYDEGAASAAAVEMTAAIHADLRASLEPAPTPDQVAEVNSAAATLRASVADLTFELPDGTTATVREFLDDLDADDTLLAAIDACTLGGRV